MDMWISQDYIELWGIIYTCYYLLTIKVLYYYNSTSIRAVVAATDSATTVGVCVNRKKLSPPGLPLSYNKMTAQMCAHICPLDKVYTRNRSPSTSKCTQHTKIHIHTGLLAPDNPARTQFVQHVLFFLPTHTQGFDVKNTECCRQITGLARKLMILLVTESARKKRK
jgi:hypothetical protein